MIHIVTDSTSDLSPEMISQYQVGIIPLAVFIQGKTYRDKLEITLAELFHSVETTGQLPKTSAPPIAEFLPHFDHADEVIFIGISSKLSATIQNAVLTADELGKRVRVIDSLNLSTGIGQLVMLAAEMREHGCSAAEIEAGVRAAIPRVRTSFTIDTLEYLYKGGRCSAMQSVVGSLLKIRPVIEVLPDGTLGVKERLRGSRAKTLASMIETFRKDLPQIDLHRVFITHTGCHVDAEYLRLELQKIAPIEELAVTLAGSVIGSHCGPNTIGIIYMLK